MYLGESRGRSGAARAAGSITRGEYQLDTRVIDGAEVARLLPGSAEALGRRALHAERRQGRAAAGGAGDRRRGAAAWRARSSRAAPCAASRPPPGGSPRSSPRRAASPASSVVLAGGAWSRLFCGNLGIELPQLKVLGSVMRTEKLDGGPEISASGGLFGYRKRMDGGYTVATLGVRTIDLVPDSFRLLPQYLPSVEAALEEAALPRRPPFRRGMAHAAALGARRDDRRSRRCACSIPAADPYVLERARASIAAAFPAFRDVAVGGKLGRHDRRDARCDPGHLGGRRDARVLHRDRVFRPRFRHRAGRRPARRRHGDRRADARRSRRRSACRASPTARTRARTRWRAEPADRADYPATASFCRSCAISPSRRPPLRWITEANSSRSVTSMLTPPHRHR